MRISDWSSDVCSSDLHARCTNSLSVETPTSCASRSANSPFRASKPTISVGHTKVKSLGQKKYTPHLPPSDALLSSWKVSGVDLASTRSEEHTSELQSLMRISYAVFCLKNKKHMFFRISNTA